MLVGDVISVSVLYDPIVVASDCALGDSVVNEELVKLCASELLFVLMLFSRGGVLAAEEGAVRTGLMDKSG